MDNDITQISDDYQIRELASQIWSYLDECHEIELSDLLANLNYSRKMVFISLDWLIRKEYIKFARSPDHNKVYLHS